MSSTNMELDVWPGDWGLPSVDIFSLQIMAYSKFSAAPVRFYASSRPWPFTKASSLPCFRHGPNVTLTDIGKMVEHLKAQNYNCDYSLTSKQVSDIKAYINYLRDKLYPALLYLWWVEEKNYVELVRPWFARVLPLPLNYLLPGHRQRAAQRFLQNVYNLSPIPTPTANNNSTSNTAAMDALEAMVMKEAQECITFLSQRLGDNEYFFGKSPCSLDAVLFGYLAPLLKAPLPSAGLQTHLKEHDNLCRFVTRICHKHFPQVAAEELRKEKSDAPEESEFPNKWRNIVLSALVASLAMIGYSFASGLIQVEIIDDGPSKLPDIPPL